MTLHEICVETTHARCFCGAPIDQPCSPSGVHYARVARACGAGLISRADFGEATHDDVITGADVLRRPGSRRVTVYDSFPADCSPSWRAACVPPPPGPEPGRLLPARTCLEGIRPPAGDDGSGTA